MKTRIVYGSLPVVTSLPVLVAYKEGYFEKHGLRFELAKFRSVAEKMLLLLETS